MMTERRSAPRSRELMAVAAAELNVAVNVSRLGGRTAWVSKLVDIWSGQYIINKGSEHGVDMSNVILVPCDGRGCVRNGLCFIEVGIGLPGSPEIEGRRVARTEPEEVGIGRRGLGRVAAQQLL